MRRLAAILCLIGATSLMAQSAGPEREAVRVRFRALSFDEPIPAASYLMGDKLNRIDIPTDGFTPVFSYAGANNLRFVTVDPRTKKAQALSPELQAALQRLRRAQAATLQISQEHEQTTEFLQKIQLRKNEENRTLSAGDIAQIEALHQRLQELGAALSANSKETEEANLAVLRLEAMPEPAQKTATKAETKPATVTSAPTTECTFRKDGDYLLIFYAAGNGYQIMVLEDDAGMFPFGSQQFINLTGKSVEIRSDGRKFPLKTNTRGMIPNQGPDYGYTVREILSEGSDGLVPGYALRTLRNPEVRTLTFLIADPDDPQAIRCRSIEDARQAEDTTKR
jgi:hypothetical protein